MTDENLILEELRAGFAEIFRMDAPTADTDLIEEGILDSFQLVELLAYLDQQFGLKIELEELELDDLRTLRRLARLVSRGRNDTGRAAGQALA